MTEAEAAKRGVTFPEPWVFSTRDLVIFVALAILIINEVAGWYFNRVNAVASVPSPMIAAVNQTSVYQSLQAHFIDQGQSRERANLNVITLMPQINQSVESLRSSGEFVHVYVMSEAVPDGVQDMTARVVEAALQSSETLRDHQGESYVQN